MISGLAQVVHDHGLAVSADLRGKVLGLAAAALAADGALARLEAAAAAGKFSLFVVFEGLPPPVPGPAARAGAGLGLALRQTERALAARGIPWLVAPGFAAAQLAALARAGVITHVLAGPGSGSGEETLLFGDVPLVLGPLSARDAEDPQPRVVPPGALVAASRLGEQAFIEAVLGAGCALNPDPPALLSQGGGTSLAAALKLSGSLGSGSFYRAIALYEQDYVPLFQRALAAVAWQPYLDETGAVVLTNKFSQQPPRDLHEVIGYRLPDEYFWYLRAGIIGPDLLRGLMWGWIDDPAAAAAGGVGGGPAAAAYQALQGELVPLRQRALGLLVAPLHRFFQAKSIEDRSARPPRVLARPATAIPTIEAVAAPLKGVDAVVADGVARTLELAGLPSGTAAASAPDALVARAGATAPDAPAHKVLVASATLALRSVAEAVIVNRLATGQASRDLPSLPFLEALPWSGGEDTA